jgi:chromosomal replication initiation ATPase DnaA
VPDEGLPEVDDQQEEIPEKAKTQQGSSSTSRTNLSDGFKDHDQYCWQEKAKKKHGQLNEKYTFENFVMGETTLPIMLP